MEAILTNVSGGVYNDDLEVNNIEDIIKIMKDYDKDVILSLDEYNTLRINIYDGYIE